MKSQLETIATTNGWKFKYARPDYMQGDLGGDDPNLLAEGEVFIGLDPVETTPRFNGSGVRESEKYTGRFLIVTKSGLDENYETKFNDHITPLDTHMITIEKALACTGLTINSFKRIEGVNLFWQNCDGFIVNFEVTNETP
jgi:hypothetical protein